MVLKLIGRRWMKRSKMSCSPENEVIRERGALMAAVERTVTTVCAWEKKAAVVEDSFARLDAPLAGFSVIEAADIDEVIRLVANTPCARAKGAIEIRPIMFINDSEWPRNPGRESDRHGIHKDDRGQDQPADKSRAQRVTHGEDVPEGQKRLENRNGKVAKAIGSDGNRPK